MKNKLIVHFLPKNFTLLGIGYDEGEAENIETKDVFPVHKISIGLLIVVFEIIISSKKGEK